MDYELIVRPEARSDLLDAFHWYQEQKSGLGLDFKLCVDEVISKLHKRPSIYKKIHRDVRRAVIKRFPSWCILHRRKQYNNYSCCFACKERSSQLEEQNITSRSSGQFQILAGHPSQITPNQMIKKVKKKKELVPCLI
mgnify:CR=1 FL=1